MSTNTNIVSMLSFFNVEIIIIVSSSRIINNNNHYYYDYYYLIVNVLVHPFTFEAKLSHFGNVKEILESNIYLSDALFFVSSYSWIVFQDLPVYIPAIRTLTDLWWLDCALPPETVNGSLHSLPKKKKAVGLPLAPGKQIFQ